MRIAKALGPAILVLVLVLAAALPARADCVAEPGRVAVRLAGSLADGDEFRRRIGAGWMFALTPGGEGWDLRLWARDGNTDMTRITPPAHGPNARQIYGWHFRNADDTGPNTGDVNAPQHLRTFLFEPRPGEAPVPEAEGVGVLEITGMALETPAGADRARMTALEFTACLTWPEAWTGVPVTSLSGRVFADCGLAEGFGLTSYPSGPLRGDFDGDGEPDMAYVVARDRDAKRGIAICRGGREVDLIGLEEPIGELVPAYFESFDWWEVAAREGAGDLIVIGKEDSSSVAIVWTGEGWGAEWRGD